MNIIKKIFDNFNTYVYHVQKICTGKTSTYNGCLLILYAYDNYVDINKFASTFRTFFKLWNFKTDFDQLKNIFQISNDQIKH